MLTRALIPACGGAERVTCIRGLLLCPFISKAKHATAMHACATVMFFFFHSKAHLACGKCHLCTAR